MTGGLIAILASVGINAVYAIRHGHTLYVVLAGGVVLAFFVSALDTFGGGGVGSALAYTFLLGTLVYRAGDLLTVLSGITNQKPDTSTGKA